MSTGNLSKEQIYNDVKGFLEIAMQFLRKTGKTDLQSQIEFMEFMNSKFIKTPLFIATIASLKELQSIKSKNNNC